MYRFIKVLVVLKQTCYVYQVLAESSLHHTQHISANTLT
jgi:hypothetical protein